MNVDGADDDEDDDDSDRDNGEIVQEARIIGHRKKARQSYEERMESIREGREGRVKYGSKKGKERGSTTNREKAKKKAFMMVVHKNGIFKKSQLSLREKQIHLRKHIDRQKKQM